MFRKPLPQPGLGNKSIDEHGPVPTELPRFAFDYSDVNEKQPTETAQKECLLPELSKLRVVLKLKYPFFFSSKIIFHFSISLKLLQVHSHDFESHKKNTQGTFEFLKNA